MVDDIACPDCAETIKAEAKVCRFCGLRLQPEPIPDAVSSMQSPSKRTRTPAWMSIAIFIVVGVAFFGLMFELFQVNDVSPQGPDTSLVNDAKAVVAKQLSDPESAQYRNIDNLGECLIGEVNAKNRLGGYVGFQEFIYFPDSKSALLDVGLPERDLPLGLGTDQLVKHSDFLDKRMDCSGIRQRISGK